MNEKETQVKNVTGPMAQKLLEKFLAQEASGDLSSGGDPTTQALARIESLLKELVELSKEQLKEIKKQQTRSKTISG